LGNRLYIKDDGHKTRTIKELSNIPFSYVGDDFVLKIGGTRGDRRES